MSDHYGIYCVWIDYSGGHNQMVAAFEQKEEAVNYASGIVVEACKKATENPGAQPDPATVVQPFILVDNTHDGAFFFRRDTIVGVRVLPDIGRDDDDDEDEGEIAGDHTPPSVTKEEFENMMTG